MDNPLQDMAELLGLDLDVVDLGYGMTMITPRPKDPDEEARIHDEDWRAYVSEDRDERIARDNEEMEAEAAR